MGKTKLDLSVLNSAYDATIVIYRDSREFRARIRLERYGNPLKKFLELPRDFNLEYLSWERIVIPGMGKEIIARYHRKGNSLYANSRGIFAPTKISQIFDRMILD